MVPKPNGRSISRPAPRRARRRDARRDEILHAAARMFRERGFADTGMRDIAEAADLSAANLYHYFRGKDEILFYCQDRALDRMLESIPRARSADPTETARLRFVLAAHVRTMLDEVEGASAHVQIDSLPPALRATIVRKRDRYERALRRILDAGMARGEFVKMDAALVTRAMLGALNWTVTWFDPAGRQPASVVGDQIADFLVRGVTVRSLTTPRAITLVRRR